MRHFLPLLLIVAMLPAPASAEGGLHITEILTDPETGEREFLELLNSGPDLDLTGWRLSDEADNSFTFGNTTLPSGARIVVWSGGESDSRGPVWNMNNVWNNGGDQALLHDPTGTLVDFLAYGSATWPDNRTDDVPAAPPKGVSLNLRNGEWVELSPTPGTAPSEESGDVSAVVENVAPTAIFTSAPGTVEPGASFVVGFEISDDNGAEDVASWVLSGDGLVLQNGTTAGAFEVPLNAPGDRDSWRLHVEVLDRSGQARNATLDVLIESAGLTIVLPATGIAFPSFPPGADEVIASATFTMRNDGEGPITPRIDVSDLTGPAQIPLQGRLSIGYEGNETVWTPYAQALTPLPELAPGEAVEVRFRLTDLPAPLPAGSYGTSFAVVA